MFDDAGYDPETAQIVRGRVDGWTEREELDPCTGSPSVSSGWPRSFNLGNNDAVADGEKKV